MSEKRFEHILRLLRPFIIHAIKSVHNLSSHDVKDIYQEFCIYMWRKNLLRQWQWKCKTKLSTYIYQCAYNMAVSKVYYGDKRFGTIRSGREERAHAKFSAAYAEYRETNSGRMERPWLSRGENTLLAVFEYLESNPRPMKHVVDNKWIYTLISNSGALHEELRKVLGMKTVSGVSMRGIRFRRRTEGNEIMKELCVK